MGVHAPESADTGLGSRVAPAARSRRSRQTYRHELAPLVIPGGSLLATQLRWSFAIVHRSRERSPCTQLLLLLLLLHPPQELEGINRHVNGLV